MKEQDTACLHTPVWGVEGFLPSTSKEVERALTTGNRVTRAFNQLPEDINTPDTINTINFEDLLMEGTTENTTTHAQEINIMDMIEKADFDFALPSPQASTTAHLAAPLVPLETTASTDTVWAVASFDDPAVGLCVSAVEAEGRVDMANNMENDIENNDLLKWIMDDTQIEDFTFPVEVEATTPAFLAFEEVKVKTEALSEEEKYRRMREQNNRASQTCRAKRKRKHQDELEELNRLEERNVVLRAQLASMEVEVAGYKKRVLSQVASK